MAREWPADCSGTTAAALAPLPGWQCAGMTPILGPCGGPTVARARMKGNRDGEIDRSTGRIDVERFRDCGFGLCRRCASRGTDRLFRGLRHRDDGVIEEVSSERGRGLRQRLSKYLRYRSFPPVSGQMPAPAHGTQPCPEAGDAEDQEAGEEGFRSVGGIRRVEAARGLGFHCGGLRRSGCRRFLAAAPALDSVERLLDLLGRSSI